MQILPSAVDPLPRILETPSIAQTCLFICLGEVSKGWDAYTCSQFKVVLCLEIVEAEGYLYLVVELV